MIVGLVLERLISGVRKHSFISIWQPKVNWIATVSYSVGYDDDKNTATVSEVTLYMRRWSDSIIFPIILFWFDEVKFVCVRQIFKCLLDRRE